MREEIRHALIVRTDAPGAWPGGRRVVKTTFEPGDSHRPGAEATILGSLGPHEGEYAYCVEWDDAPGVPVFVRAYKIALITFDRP